MSKSVWHRTASPIGPLFIFDPIAEVLRDDMELSLGDVQENGSVNIDNMSPTELQAIKKSKTGRGFRPGTSYEDMVTTVKEIV